MKILVDKIELENALQLIVNIGTKEYTVEEISSVLNIVAYILGNVLDKPGNLSFARENKLQQDSYQPECCKTT